MSGFRRITMLAKISLPLAAAFVAIAVSGTAADAARKQQTSVSAGSSLDGRVLGYPRSCWSDMYQPSGDDSGPICH
jgi:hypothetical protein